MNTALWVAQGVLAVLFMMAGAMKLMQPKEKLAEKMGWVNDFSDNMIKCLGGLEVLAAIGLILPPVVGIAAVLAPLAAAGLVVMMIGAAVVHARRKEPHVMMNLMLLAIAAFVAWGRFGPHSF